MSEASEMQQEEQHQQHSMAAAIGEEGGGAGSLEPNRSINVSRSSEDLIVEMHQMLAASEFRSERLEACFAVQEQQMRDMQQKSLITTRIIGELQTLSTHLGHQQQEMRSQLHNFESRVSTSMATTTLKQQEIQTRLSQQQHEMEKEVQRADRSEKELIELKEQVAKLQDQMMVVQQQQQVHQSTSRQFSANPVAAGNLGINERQSMGNYSPITSPGLLADPPPRMMQGFPLRQENDSLDWAAIARQHPPRSATAAGPSNPMITSNHFGYRNDQLDTHNNADIATQVQAETIATLTANLSQLVAQLSSPAAATASDTAAAAARPTAPYNNHHDSRQPVDYSAQTYSRNHQIPRLEEPITWINVLLWETEIDWYNANARSYAIKPAVGIPANWLQGRCQLEHISITDISTWNVDQIVELILPPLLPTLENEFYSCVEEFPWSWDQAAIVKYGHALTTIEKIINKGKSKCNVDNKELAERARSHLSKLHPELEYWLPPNKQITCTELADKLLDIYTKGETALKASEGLHKFPKSNTRRNNYDSSRLRHGIPGKHERPQYFQPRQRGGDEEPAPRWSPQPHHYGAARQQRYEAPPATAAAPVSREPPPTAPTTTTSKGGPPIAHRSPAFQTGEPIVRPFQPRDSNYAAHNRQERQHERGGQYQRQPYSNGSQRQNTAVAAVALYHDNDAEQRTDDHHGEAQHVDDPHEGQEAYDSEWEGIQQQFIDYGVSAAGAYFAGAPIASNKIDSSNTAPCFLSASMINNNVYLVKAEELTSSREMPQVEVMVMAAQVHNNSDRILKMPAHIDTGCEYSLIDRSLVGGLQSIGADIDYSPVQVIGVNGTAAAVGRVRLRVQAAAITPGAVRFEDTFIIMDKAPVPLLLCKQAAVALGFIAFTNPTQPTAPPLSNLKHGDYADDEEDEETAHEDHQELPTIGDHVPAEIRPRMERFIQRNRECFNSAYPTEPARLIEPPRLPIDPADRDKIYSNKPPGRLNETMIQMIKKLTEEFMLADLIEPTTAKGGARAHLVLRRTDPHGPLKVRLVVNYAGLNRLLKTIPCEVGDLRMILNSLASGMKLFSSIDIAHAFYCLQLHEEDRILTAVDVGNGIPPWQFKRWPMGLTSSPAAFSQAMRQVLQGLIGRSADGKFVIHCYADDIGIAAKDWDGMMTALESIFERLKKHNIHVSPKKCTFGVESLKILGSIISADSISIDPARVESIANMKPPKDISSLRSVLGVFNWIRSFVRAYAEKAAPLLALLKKGAKWKWNEQEQQSFDDLKRFVLEAPQLAAPDYQSEFPLEVFTDSSCIGCGGVLAQFQQGTYRPIAFCSHAFSTSELKWDIVAKEGYALRSAFKAFHNIIFGQEILAHVDATAILNLRNSSVPKFVRWRQFMDQYPHHIVRVAGVTNVVSDALSRAFTATVVTPAIERAHGRHGGHFGWKTTFQRLRAAGHNWPEMKQEVQQYVRSCGWCQKNRNFVVPETAVRNIQRWEPFAELCSDVAGPYPTDKSGMQYVCCTRDNFTGYVFLSAMPDATAESHTHALLQAIAVFGPPTAIRTDKGSAYCSDLVQRLCQALGTEHITTLVAHPQSNGQAERTVGLMRKQLSILSNQLHMQDNWSRLLPLIMYQLNATVSPTLGIEPLRLITPGLTPFRQLFADTSVPITQSTEEYLAQLLDLQDELLAKVTQRRMHILEKRQNKQAENIICFQPGDYVLSTYAVRPPTKTASHLRGPFRVTTIENDNIVHIQSLIDDDHKEEIHASRLVKFILGPGNPTDLRILAAADKNEELLDCIVEHRIARDETNPRKRQWEFRARWTDRDSSEDTWLSRAALIKTVAFDRYRQEHPEIDRPPPSR